MRITKQVAVWDDFDRADGAPGSNAWEQAWKQVSGNFTITSMALVRTGSFNGRSFTLLPGALSTNIELNSKIRTCATTNQTDLGFMFRSLDSTTTRAGQLYISIRKTATANSIRLLLRTDLSGSDTVLATNTTAGWADNTDYTIRIVANGTAIEMFVDGVSKLTHTLSGANDTYLTGNDVGVSFTNSDLGSKIYDFYVIDKTLPATPATTTTKLIAHRGTPASAADITEQQISGLSLLPEVNGPEVDTWRTSDGDYYLNHDSTFDRTSPTGATGSCSNVSTATWIAAGMTELGYYLDNCIQYGFTDIFVQLSMNAQSDINGVITLLNAHAAKDNITVMTTATGGATPRLYEIRTAGWTGKLGCFGLTTANWASDLSTQFSTYNVDVGFLAVGDSGYDANISLIATLHAAGYKVGGSTLTPARFVSAVTNNVEYVLTDYPSEFVLWYKPPTETATGFTGVPTTGQVWPRSRTTVVQSEVPAAREIIAGEGLTGGGDLSDDVTIDVGAGTGITVTANSVALDTSYTDNRYINTLGDTMSGDLILNADPSNVLGAVTKQYVDAIELTPGPPGPPGQSAGRIFYYAYTDASDIATYKTMLASPSAGSEQTVPVSCSGTGDNLVAVFATDPGVPGAADYPAGVAFRRIYGSTSAGAARYHLQVYVRNLAGTETLVRDEYSNSFTDTVATLQEWNTTAANSGTLLSTDRIVNKIYAQRVSGPGTITVTTYFEGSTHVSHIQTTISQSQPPLNTFKEPCRVVSTTNQSSLIGLLTIDGITLNALDRVLLTGQTTTSENGIYYAQTSAWARAVDADANGEISDGMHVPITEGTIYADSLWRCTSTSTIPWVPGTSGSTWSNTGVITLADEGTLVTPRRTIVNFVGAGVTVADDAANNRTNITVPGGLDQTTADTRYVNITGDTITGDLILNADPTDVLGAATKQYVDNQTSNVVTPLDYSFNTTTTPPPGAGQLRLNNATQSSATTMYVSYDTAPGADVKLIWTKTVVTGDVIVLQDKDDSSKWQRYTVSATPTDNTTYCTITVAWVDGGTALTAARALVFIKSPGGLSQTVADTRYVNVDGDTMTGYLILNANPTNVLGAATKQYVDARTPQTTVASTAPLSPSTGDVWIDTT